MAIISLTSLLQHIHGLLGVSHHIKELSDEALIDIVVKETLPTFSIYFPHMVRHMVSAHDDAVPNLPGTFYIKTNFEVLNINKLITGNYSGGGSSQTYYTQYNNDPFDRQIQADYLSMVENPVTWIFHSPNMVEIMPKNMFFNFLLELQCVHPKHLQTINPMLREYFFKLARFDIYIRILAIRKHFQEIGTSFGEKKQLLTNC